MVKTSKDLSKAVAAAAEAEQAAARQRDSPEKKQARMDELEERARLFGDSVKQSYNAKCLDAQVAALPACPRRRDWLQGFD